MKYLFVTYFLFSCSFGYAQGWQQVYPPWDVNRIRVLCHWNGDTIYGGCSNGVLVRSVDGGETWQLKKFFPNYYLVYDAPGRRSIFHRSAG